MILDDARENKKPCNIIVTQPRRIAARSIADRVATERSWELGSVVGYQVNIFLFFFSLRVEQFKRHSFRRRHIIYRTVLEFNIKLFFTIVSKWRLFRIFGDNDCHLCQLILVC